MAVHAVEGGGPSIGTLQEKLMERAKTLTGMSYVPPVNTNPTSAKTHDPWISTGPMTVENVKKTAQEIEAKKSQVTWKDPWEIDRSALAGTSGSTSKSASKNAAGEFNTISGRYECVYTTLQQMHTFSSYTDILYNDIIASARDIVTNVSAIYSVAGATHTAPTVMADYTIRSDLQKTEIVDTGTVQNVLGPLFPDALLYYSGIRPGEDIAMMYAKSHLVSRLRDMYRGELLVRGKACLKPYDIFYLADYQNKMYGLAEVGRVVHSLTPDTGLITSIKPDLIARQVDLASKWFDLHNGITAACTFTALRLMHVGAQIRQKGSAYLAARMARLAALGKSIVNKLSSVKQVQTALVALDKVKDTAQALDKLTDVAVTASAGTLNVPALILSFIANIAIDLAVTGLINNLVRTVENFINNLHTVKIYPLYLKGKPFVAGITGAKHLIAYGPYDELMKGQSSIGYGEAGQRMLPDGRYLSAPSDRKGTITSSFGKLRFNQELYKDKEARRHQGLDIAFYPANAPIRAALGGTVSKVGFDPFGYGNYVIIDHGNGIQTLYAHLSSVSVSQGQKVNTGTVIGRQGSTGRSTGPHLHFELRINGEKVDPEPYLPPSCYK